MDLEAITQSAMAEVMPADHVQDMLEKWFRAENPDYALADDDLDPRNVADAGWGVIFPYGSDPSVRAALDPLIIHRQGQASAKSAARFRVFDGPAAYRPTESVATFLGRQGFAPGPIEPDRMPMYLLLVGGPEQIPFAFQYQLDVQYAVGRVWFETADGKPDLAAFDRYARAVVAADTSPARPRRVVLTGTCHPDDPATEQSATLFVEPLARLLAAGHPDWAVEYRPPAQCTRAELLGLLAPGRAPGLLLTATHGMMFPLGGPDQRAAQGALVCQDFPGRAVWGVRPISPAHYLSGADLPATGCDGMVAFLFACHGAGTPRLDDYPHPRLPAPAEIAGEAFVACLPQRLLAAGATAVIGHVDRAWPCSFVWRNSGPQLQAFRSVFQRLLRGEPVGWACDKLNLRYAELAAGLSDALKDLRYGKAPDADFGYLWTATNDARAYVILGDPATRALTTPPVAA